VSPDRYLTPREIEATGLADADMVRAWIASGQLRAFNAARSPRNKKPRWRIAEADLAEFLRARSSQRAASPAVTSRRRPRPKREVVEFF
jgi:hypothetical protein